MLDGQRNKEPANYNQALVIIRNVHLENLLIGQFYLCISLFNLQMHHSLMFVGWFMHRALAG